jgi:lysophospholipase L1-like esterase
MNLKNIFFGIILIAIPFLFTLLLFFGAEYYLKYKAEAAGIFYKFNNERIIKLEEQVPGSVIFTASRDENGNLTRSGIDDQGFLLPKSKHKDPDLILGFLGGSTTYQAEVQPKDNFHYLVGTSLEKRLNIKVKSLNAGTSGIDTTQTINILFNKVLPQKPDYVLLMHAVNDLNKLLVLNEYWNSQSFRQLLELKYSFGNSLRYFKNRYFPHTYLAIRPLFNYFSIGKEASNKFKLISKNDEWKKYRGKKLNFDEDLILSQFRSAQLTAVMMAKNWGATPILLIQPNLISKNSPGIYNFQKGYIQNIKKNWGLSWMQYQTIYQKFLQEIRNIAKESNIPIVDLDRGIPSSRKYFADVIHINTTGSKMVAQLITNVLEKEISKCLNKVKKVRCVE